MCTTTTDPNQLNSMWEYVHCMCKRKGGQKGYDNLVRISEWRRLYFMHSLWIFRNDNIIRWWFDRWLWVEWYTQHVAGVDRAGAHDDSSPMIVNLKLTLERVYQNEWATFLSDSTDLYHTGVLWIGHRGAAWDTPKYVWIRSLLHMMWYIILSHTTSISFRQCLGQVIDNQCVMKICKRR